VALTGSPRSAADSRARAERNTGFVQRRVQSVSAAQGFRSCCPAELDALQPAAFTLATLSFTAGAPARLTPPRFGGSSRSRS
jgi:hypothetical protein